MEKKPEKEYPSPSGEEILVGALSEMMQELGIDPLARASSRSEASIQGQVTPDWFLQLSEDI